MTDLSDRVSSDEKKAAEPISEDATLTPGLVKELSARNTSVVSKTGEIINASGHRDQLQRQYGLLSICGLALNIDNAWIAFGGSLSVSVLNGGPPGTSRGWSSEVTLVGELMSRQAYFTSSSSRVSTTLSSLHA